MNNQQIMEALRGRLNHNNITFMGCLAADQLAKLEISRGRRSRPIAFIANVLSAEKSHIMGHWVAYLIAEDCIYFFDSYALDPIVYSKYFRYFLNKHKVFNIYKLASRLQSNDSLVCGAYCIQFIFLCSRVGLSKTCQFLKCNYKSGSFKMNDRKVIKYVYKNFKMPMCRKTFCTKKRGLSYKTCLREVCRPLE